jgi:hypothetical protein
MFFDGAPSYSLVLPLVLLVGSFLVSRTFKLAWTWTVAGGLVPMALPLMPLPFSQEFVTGHPQLIIGGGWLVLMGAAIGWVAARPAVEGAIASVGLVKFIYFVVLAGALGVTGLLLANPDVLQEMLPGWRGSMGVILLCASLLSMSIALARVVKAAALFAVWSGVSLILASEIFLGKLPYNVLRDDLRNLESLVPQSVLGGIRNSLDSAVSVSRDGLKALVLSGSPSSSKIFSGQRSFGSQIEDVLRRGGVDINVQDLSRPDASIYDLHEAARRELAAQKPDLVFIMGWASDATQGMNSFGLPGLTELGARQNVDKAQKLLRYPWVSEVLGSRLFRYVATEYGEVGSQQAPFRVPVEEYRTELAGMVGELQALGITVVLISEPHTVHPDEALYRAALETVAHEAGVLYVDAEQVLQERGGNRHLGARGRLISTEAMNELAVVTAQRLAEHALNRSKDGAVAKSFGPEFDSAPGELPEYQLSGVLGEAVNVVVNPREAGGDLIFKIRHLDTSNRYYRVVFSVNGKFVADRRLNERDSARVRFKIPEEFMNLSFVELTIRTVASPGGLEDAIGTSDSSVPVPVSVFTDDEVSEVRVAEDRLSTSEDFAVSIVDPVSGEVVDSLVSDNGEQVGRWIMAKPWGSIVAGAGRASLSPESLRYIGIAPSSAPQAFVGVAGSRSPQGVSKSGDGAQDVELGGKVVHSMSRFLLEDVTLESSGKSLLVTAR